MAQAIGAQMNGMQLVYIFYYKWYRYKLKSNKVFLHANEVKRTKTLKLFGLFLMNLLRPDLYITIISMFKFL